MTDTTEQHGTFTFVVDWPKPSAESAEAIRAFWLREGAMQDPTQLDARIPQVVLHALGPDGEVAGVCTAIVSTPPHIGQPLYYWRTFIGSAYRKTPLVRMLLIRSCELLGDHARANDFPCIGIILELENGRFKDAVRSAIWWNPRFYYIGRSARGLDLRLHYFKGARLKAPK